MADMSDDGRNLNLPKRAAPGSGAGLALPGREEKILEYAKEQKIAYQNYKNLLECPRVYQFIESRIEEHSKNLASYEKIKYFVLLEQDFTQSSGELTPTLKVKRDVVFSRYREKLLALYEKEKG